MIPNNSANVFSKLEKFKQVRRRQAFCPVAKHRTLVSPLTVADDLSLRTMITSPDIYDRELSRLIFEHCEFPDLSDRPKYENFIEAMSHFDKKILLWAIFDATYKTLGEQDFTCPKCSEEFKEEVLSKDLIVEDTIKQLWTKPVPFQQDHIEYTYDIGEDDLDKIVFFLSIPTIKRHLDMLKLLDVTTIKSNMNNFGTLMSKTEELSLITNQVQVFFDKENPPDELKTVREVHKLIGDYIPLDYTKEIVDKFNDEYGKLDPEFKKIITCPSCGHEFEFKVDMEVALFKSFLGV
jgi:hypothetical protein